MRTQNKGFIFSKFFSFSPRFSFSSDLFQKAQREGKKDMRTDTNRITARKKGNSFMMAGERYALAITNATQFTESIQRFA